MKNMCGECKVSTVAIAKYGLCMKCYQKAYRAGKKPDATTKDCSRTIISESHAREIQFIKNFFDHPQWIHHPAIFKIGFVSYSPDFYDAKRNVFIEVAGTRQAYHQNKQKLIEFKKHYPLINFEIRQTSGETINPLDEARKSWDCEKDENKY